MILSSLLVLFWTVFAPVLAAPTTIVGQWTLSGLRRSCSPTDNKCEYNFSLDEHTGPENVMICTFTVDGTAESDFGSKACSNNPRLHVQAGWNKTGAPEDVFMTLVVTDMQLSADSFFGYKETDFGELGIVMQSITRPAYSIGTFGPDPAESGAESDLASGSDNDDDDEDDSDDDIVKRRDYEDEDGWIVVEARQTRDLGKVQISDLRRTWDEEDKAIFTSFMISTTDGDSVRCELRITDTEPEGSWYSRGPCDKFTISWGYNDFADSAVMTVCNSNTGMAAFVGFDGVSDLDKTYAPSRWEPYHIAGCK
ncbi:hypothetical protein B0T16DRAFT_455254 [Cercophora newfieldiana]|uniref:Uncharacterized protein n=1 Tax=Cercophora newfieldiana TaxID=92897 RepID=A0AA39YKZ7_9PEZI|nr:hypothetical protein B0T16DRAFT_455254 [Cercophora newfieldiana]